MVTCICIQKKDMFGRNFGRDLYSMTVLSPLLPLRAESNLLPSSMYKIFSFTVSFHDVSSGIEPVTVNGKIVLPL